jgi:hypothetical protein
MQSPKDVFDLNDESGAIAIGTNHRKFRSSLGKRIGMAIAAEA